MSERRRRPFLGHSEPDDDFYAQFYGPRDTSGDRPIRDEEPKRKAFWGTRDRDDTKPVRPAKPPREPKPARTAREPKVAVPKVAVPKVAAPEKEVRVARSHREPRERTRGPLAAWIVARRSALGVGAGVIVVVTAGVVLVSGATSAGNGKTPHPQGSTSGVPFDLAGIAGQPPASGPAASGAGSGNGAPGGGGAAAGGAGGGTGGNSGGTAAGSPAAGGAAGSSSNAGSNPPGSTQPATSQPGGSTTSTGPGPVSSSTTSNPPPSSPTTTSAPPSSPHPTCVLSALGQCLTLPSIP